MKTISFIIHGKLSHHKMVLGLEEFFKEDFKVKFFFTKKPQHAIELARNAVVQGTDFLIAVGGDGTLNEVVNGLMQNPEETRKHIFLGLIPAGSGNDFARTIGVENDLHELKKYMKEEMALAIDLDLLQYNSIEGKPAQRYFINITDIGIGGIVAQKLHSAPRFFGAGFAYFVSIVRGFLAFKHQEVKLTYDGKEWQGKILSLCMANGAWFGSGMGVAPKANPCDGKMQLTVMGNVTLLDYFKYLPAIKRAEIVQHQEIQYLEAVNCSIESTGEACSIDMDGDFIGYTPVEMATISGEIRFLTGKKF